MKRIFRCAAAGSIAVVLAAGCDPVLESGADLEGMRFNYSGAANGTFASEGMVESDGEGLPELETFAMAQRDSIGGLLLGSFRKSGEGRGDLFILQIRGTDEGSYECAAVTGGSTCYGHLYIGVEIGSETVAAEEIYGIASGEVVLDAVTDERVRGDFELMLRDVDDETSTISVANGSLDVPLVEGVFNSSFACLITRLQEGAEAGCE
jgi:hypothetical protein